MAETLLEMVIRYRVAVREKARAVAAEAEVARLREALTRIRNVADDAISSGHDPDIRVAVFELAYVALASGTGREPDAASEPPGSLTSPVAVWASCSCDRTYHDECPDHGVYGAGLGPSGSLTSPVDPPTFTRQEIGALIDAVAATVDRERRGNARLLRRLQELYTVAPLTSPVDTDDTDIWTEAHP